MPRRPVFALFATLVAGALAGACGPSLTTVHEGAVRFEHCYRLDLEADASTEEQRACWSHWLGSYTNGQSRDRIDYARRRVAAIDDSNREPPKLRLAGEQRPEQRQFYLMVPAPSSVHASPPPVLTPYQPAPATDASGSDTARATADEAPRNAKTPPAEGCAASCRSTWQSCESTCPAQPGVAKPSAACACENTYGNCMRRCFE